jgi:hypothetical protein
MKHVLVLISFLFCLQARSQDSSSRSFVHLIGVEFVGTTGRSTGYGHASAYTRYNPGYSVFYRTEYKNVFGMEARLNYRSGYGSHTDGGLGGSSTVEGDFQVLRIDGGVLWMPKSKSEFGSFVCGAKVGYSLSKTGNIVVNNFSGYGSSSHKANPSNELAQYYYSIFVGAALRFKIANKYRLYPGYRFYLESNDFENTSLNISLGLNIAYRFW